MQRRAKFIDQRKRCIMFYYCRKFHQLELEFVGDGSGGYNFYKLGDKGDSRIRLEGYTK